MAESYCCGEEWVHFSNGACQTLQLTWARIARAYPEDEAMRVISSEFEERSRYATGMIAVGIIADYLGDPFSRKEVKVAWLSVMDELIRSIRSGNGVSLEMDINWGDELRDSWCSRLGKMRKCLSEQV